MTPSVGSVSLLEQLTELGKTVHLLDHCLIVESVCTILCITETVTQEQPDGRDVQGKEWGEGAEPPWPLQVPLSPHPTCSQTLKLSEPRPFGVLWRLLYRRMIDQIIGR